MTTVDIPAPIALPSSVSQSTAIEQSRAIAEVQAAVVVAQQCPRDMARGEAEMKDVCGRLSLANRAFYSVPNRGNGPTVHLMRELARIWGNIQHGVHELRRDDTAGESEIHAFAWDCQTNTRSSRTFVVPHARMKKVAGKQTREPLIDLQDIYLSNQNIGARAVRECISTVLPTWYTELAQDLCRATLENGEGVPLSERITNMVQAFDRLGVDLGRMEQKIGRRKGQWTAADVADMVIAHTSITREGLDANEVFPQVRVSAAELTAQARIEPPEVTE
jgi:hypothetical protein